MLLSVVITISDAYASIAMPALSLYQGTIKEISPEYWCQSLSQTGISLHYAAMEPSCYHKQFKLIVMSIVFPFPIQITCPTNKNFLLKMLCISHTIITGVLNHEAHWVTLGVITFLQINLLHSVAVRIKQRHILEGWVRAQRGR